MKDTRRDPHCITVGVPNLFQRIPNMGILRNTHITNVYRRSKLSTTNNNGINTLRVVTGTKNPRTVKLSKSKSKNALRCETNDSGN